MNGLGVVLETARRAKGLTQEELAQHLGIAQATLSRYEHGMREPDDDALSRIATALDVTSAFLREAGKVRGAVALDAHMRRLKGAKPSEWRRLEARLNIYRLHAARVFDQIAVHTEHRVPTFNPDETDPVTAARFVRAQWRMPAGPVRGLIAWLEAAGCVIIEEDFGRVGVDGLSQWIDALPIILVNSVAPTDRKRLTIVHELGHLCLHSGDLSDDIEHDASLFAAEFLMPMEVIRPSLRNLTIGRLHDLKLEWAVSMQALIERAHEGKLIAPARRSSLYKALSARGWRLREPLSDELAPEHPSLVTDIGVSLLSQGLSPEEIADVVGYDSPRLARPFLQPGPRLLRAL